MSRFPLVVAVPVALGALLLLGGCVSREDLARIQSQAESLRLELGEEIAELEDLARSLPEDHPARSDALAQLQQARALDGAMEAAIARIEAVVHESEAPSSPITQLAGWLAPWLPEPARTPALLGSALLVSLVRSWRLKEGFRSVVKGFDRALKEDEAFSQAFKRNAPTFREVQTPLAQRLVDSMGRRA